MGEIASVVGRNVKLEILSSLVLGHIRQELEKNTLKTVENILVVFHSSLRFVSREQVLSSLETIVRLFETLEDISTEELGVAKSSQGILVSIVAQIPENSLAPFSQRLFGSHLAIQATLTRENSAPAANGEHTEALARCCGYRSSSEMYCSEVREILEKMYLEKEYSKWEKTSRDRFKFAVIVRFCSQGIAKYMEIVIDIISKCTEPVKDSILKYDMLELLHYLVATPDTQGFIKENATTVLKKIVCQVLVWRAGSPNEKIRKAGVICLLDMMQNGIVEGDAAYTVYPELLATLKSCLGDDWAPDLRLLTCRLMTRLIDLLRSHLSSFELSDLYKILLERLDDAQDRVRIEVTLTLKSLLLCDHLSVSDSTFEYIARTCFVHLDDNNTAIQDSIFEFLRFAAGVNREIVLKEASEALPKLKFPTLCNALIKELSY